MLIKRTVETQQKVRVFEVYITYKTIQTRLEKLLHYKRRDMNGSLVELITAGL